MSIEGGPGICPWCHQDLPVGSDRASLGTRRADPWPGVRAGLTRRESQVIELIAQGMSNSEISAVLYISENTIKSYVRGSYRKMGVNTRAGAVRWAVNHGFDVMDRDCQ